MKNTLSQFQLARLTFEDLAGFLRSGTTSTRHGELALFVAANQANAERELSDFLIGEKTDTADQVANAWHVLVTGFGLVLGAAIVQAAGIVLEEWEKRERAVPARLTVGKLWEGFPSAPAARERLENGAETSRP